MIRRERRRDAVELNMAPMIDMVFLLIIFFLTATTFTEREREQDVLLPANRIPGSLSRSFESNIIVNVLKDGAIRVFGAPASPAELVDLLAARKAQVRVPLKVQVRADRRSAYGSVARALEAIEAAGIQRPYIVTKSVEIEE